MNETLTQEKPLTETHKKIVEVLGAAQKPLVEHEFGDFYFKGVTARQYVGCSYSSLMRRLRELKNMGIVKSQLRPGEQFKEWSLVTPTQLPEAQKNPAYAGNTDGDGREVAA
jgi:hypothetical protein